MAIKTNPANAKNGVEMSSDFAQSVDAFSMSMIKHFEILN
jgi:hypothetical protein